jgi:hypothetical protein
LKLSRSMDASRYASHPRKPSNSQPGRAAMPALFSKELHHETDES